jgi:hypothetical protein
MKIAACMAWLETHASLAQGQVPGQVPGQILGQNTAGAMLRAEGQARNLDCAGQDAVIGGSRNTAVFTGSCAMLQIRGDDNTVSVALAQGALIDIEGSRNRVRFSTQPGTSPRLRAVGAGIDVSPLAGSQAPSADSAQLVGERQTLTLDCNGGPATIAGSRNQITLLGACRALTLRGEASVVRASLAAAAQVSIEGNAIALIYSVQGAGTPPLIILHGMGSEAVRAGREGALALRDPKSGAIVGTVPVLVRDLDATIVQAGTLVNLPPAVFNKAALSAAGEMQLDRLVALIAQTSPHGVIVIGRDPSNAPAVQAWLRSRGVKSVSLQTPADPAVSAISVLALR